MSELKATRGDWQFLDAEGKCLSFSKYDWYVENEKLGHHMFVPVHADGKVVALVVGAGDEKDTVFANAHLIAQSPAMYAELDGEVLNSLLGMIEDSGDTEMWSKAVLFMSRRDEILAKARGEQS